MAVTLMKQDKVLVIAQEILNTGADTYDITGIDLGRALYFFIEPQRTSQEMALGDYTIRVVGANQYLDINASDMKDNATLFQICYEETLDSSQYNPVGDPDINTLVDRYNEVQQDLSELWDAFAEGGFKIDALGQAQILPLLGDGESWYWDEALQEYRGIAVANVEVNVERVTEEGDTQVARVEATGDAYIVTMIGLRDQTQTYRDETFTYRNEAEGYRDECLTIKTDLENSLTQIETNRTDIIALDTRITTNENTIASNAKFKQYSSLADLGLTAPVTVLQVVQSMEDLSMLMMNRDAGVGNVTDVPQNGVLEIIRINNFRCSIRLTGSGDTVENKLTLDNSYYNGVVGDWRVASGTISYVGRYSGGSRSVYVELGGVIARTPTQGVGCQVPITGLYSIKVTGTLPAVASRRTLTVYLNGSVIPQIVGGQILDVVGDATTTTEIGSSLDMYLSEGDIIDIVQSAGAQFNSFVISITLIS